jgi:oligopeptidase A
MSETPPSARPFLSPTHPLPFQFFEPSRITANVEVLLNQADEQLKEIESSSDLTYAGVLGALDRLGEHLESCMTMYSQLESLLGSEEIRAAMREVQPKVSAFYAQIPFSADLYSKIKSVSESDEITQLMPHQRRYLEQTLLSFQRNGAELDQVTKKRLVEIESLLSQKTMDFSKNVVEETDAFEWVTTDESKLAGLPASALASAAQSAKSKELDGWRFTLQGPSFISIMTYCDDSSVREHLYTSYITRASSGDRDNAPLIKEILLLRKEKATLLGYRDVSDLFLASRMVKAGQHAQLFVDQLIETTMPFAEQEHQELNHFAQETLKWGRELEPWDISYVAEKLKRAECGFDEEALKPYFEVKSVMQGMFEIIERLYNVEIKPLAGISTWHEDVMTFELCEAGDTLGVFYADLFPREGKQGGAWMCPLLYKNDQQPHVGLICANFTPPIDGLSLITHREVETLFHEFGHLLHHLLTDAEIRSQAGTNVAWDFVELPSQIMENWCWEREALDLFARHYHTGDALPEDLFSQLKKTQTFRAASGQMRQLTFAEIDLKLHREYRLDADGKVLDYARAVMGKRAPTRLPAQYAMIAGFGHLFASPTGYASGYYSYKWAEVLDADAFTRFKQEGIFSPEVGRDFRLKLLSKGDSIDPAQLFEQFMGRSPNSEALIQRLGLS